MDRYLIMSTFIRHSELYYCSLYYEVFPRLSRKQIKLQNAVSSIYTA